MEAKRKRNILPGNEFDRLFPASENNNKTIRRNANVDDTVAFIPKVVGETLDQTKAIAKILKGNTLYETCANIWQFVYQHINYQKDKEGYEQIRSPARTWYDRKQGVDCDCYSVFISSILSNLGIAHLFRITKYHRNYFQHIYPIVQNGTRQITIDCVTDKFDYEVPYSEKKDYPMDLQYLNGFEGDPTEDLGKIIKRTMAKGKTIPAFQKKNALLLSKKARKAGKIASPAVAANTAPNAAPKKKKKGFFKKVLNVVNKVNPATVLLRNGVLAAMKLNIKNVAGRLRWSYLTPEQALAKGVDVDRFQKLVRTRQKLEEIFYGAGGNPDNLRKAILKGKGNKDKAVNGLGMLPMMEWNEYMTVNTPLNQLLGQEIFLSENVDGMRGFQGLGALGEPITLTSIGAAMGVIAGIVASLKSVGDIFKKKGKGSEDFDESKTDAPENNISPSQAATSSSIVTPDAGAVRVAAPGYSDGSAPSGNSMVTANEGAMVTAPSSYPASVSAEPASSESVTASDVSTNNLNPPATAGPSNTNQQGFWEKNKAWLKPAVIGAGGLTVIAIAYKLSKTSKTPGHSSSHGRSLSGLPKKRKKKNHHKHRRHHHKRRAIALI